MKKLVHYPLFFALVVFFCQCGGGSDKQNGADNDSLKTTQDTTQSTEQDSGDSNNENGQASPEQKIKNLIQEYFALYAKQDWDALAGYYTSNITQFIGLKNAKPAQVTEAAKRFFKNKTNIQYTPDMTTCKITESQMGWNTTLELDMQWDNQKSRVLLALSFMHPDYKIVHYSEEKIISSEKEQGDLGNQSVVQLFKSIPTNLQVPGMDMMYALDTTAQDVATLGFGAVSQTWQATVKRLKWQGRTILVSVHHGGSSQLTADRQWRVFTLSTNVYFFEKTAQGWQTPQLLSAQAKKEIGEFFSQNKVRTEKVVEVKASFPGNDISIVQGSKKMQITWDAGTYRIVSKEGD